MTDRDQLQRDRDRLAAQVAELDRQLAAPVLPEGWVDASEKLPPKFKCVFIVDAAEAIDKDPADGRWAMAFHDGHAWDWPGAWNGDFKGNVYAWHPIPADWLRPAAEAEAMVKPKELSPQTPRDTTNALLVAFHDAPHKLNGDTFDAIAERITAYDRLIDPATLFDIAPARASDGKAYIAKVQHGNCKPIAIPAYQEGGVWRHTCGATVSGKVIALADPDRLLPAKLIGGGE